MKRVIAILVLVVMAIGIAGCGFKQDEGTPTLVWYLPNPKQADTPLISEEVSKLIEPKIGAKVDIRFIEPSEFSEKMSMMMASQEDFDLCFTGYTNPYLDGARKGGFLELTELLNEYGKDIKAMIPDYLWEATYVDDGIYAVPNYQSMTKSRAVYFQKALVDKYNFDVSSVKTLKDIEPFLEKIRDNEQDLFPFKLTDVETFYPDPYKYQETSIKNVLIDSTTKELVFEQDVPERYAARKMIQDWYKRGFIRKDVAVAQGTSQTSYACWPTDGHRPGELEEREDAYGVELVAAPLTDFYMYRTGATTTMTAISATSKHPEKAMQFLNLINTDAEVFNLIAYGIEGKHYEKVDEKHIRKVPESTYNPGRTWSFGCVFNAYLLEGVQDDLWEQIQHRNDESEKGILIGFAADTSSVNSIISQMANIISEYDELNNGTSTDLEGKTAEFNKKMEAAGKADLMKFAEEVVGEYMREKNIK